jgi:methylglutaconyl-CoA hydratase
MNASAVEIEYADAVAWIWMNRPQVHNAFDEALIEELTGAFLELGTRANVRVIVLAGRGKSFSAGADVDWMKRQGAASEEDNFADALRLANLFRTIAVCAKPTIARVHGTAMGGGVGLVAACDIAIGSSVAVFAMSEVRLGLIPATIAPYVLRAIGERHARRLFQTGERIDAATAQGMGLLHQVAPPEELDEQVEVMIRHLLAGGPRAQKAAKELIDAVANEPITNALVEDTARRIANCRAQPEASEGLNAFLEKRHAAWVSRR